MGAIDHTLLFLLLFFCFHLCLFFIYPLAVPTRPISSLFSHYSALHSHSCSGLVEARDCRVVLIRWAKFPDSRFRGWPEERGGERGTQAGFVSLVVENDVNAAWVRRFDSYWDQPC